MGTDMCDATARDLDVLVDEVVKEFAEDILELSGSLVDTLLDKGKSLGIPLSLKQGDGVPGRNYYVAFTILSYKLFRMANITMVFHKQEDI